jgi:tetratricopeptide (TPR) repeat protein
MPQPDASAPCHEWQIAASPLRHGEERVEGGPILEEVPGEAGTALFVLYRELMLLLEHPQLARESGWREALRQASGGTEPENANVAELCLRHARWARENGHRATELALTQAAALFSPANPSLAVDVARLARDLGDYPRAESWYGAAVRLARRARAWEPYVTAYIGLANLYLQIGNLPAVRALARRAVRTTDRYRLDRAYAGQAYHALFITASEAGDSKEAHDLALRAFTCYGRDHARLLPLAHDVAYFWLSQGQFGRALTVIEAVLPHALPSDDMAIGFATAARAAAGLGNRVKYQEYVGRAVAELKTCLSTARAAEVLLTLARAAATLGDSENVKDFAARAHALAVRHGLAQLRLQAEAELGSTGLDAVHEVRRPETLASRKTADQLASALVKVFAVGITLALVG